MLNWLIYTFGSFFINKRAREGATRSFWNVLFAIFASFIILVGLFAAGYNGSFATHYDNASNFKEFLYHSFASEDVNKRINLKTSKNENETLVSAFYGLDTNNLAIINTFENEDDANNYSLNGYNLIVDTRNSNTTYFQFEVTYVNKDDKSITKTEAEYQALDNDTKAKYQLSTYKMLGKEVVYDATNNDKYINYLNDAFASSNADTKNYDKWQNIQNAEDKTTQNYYKNVYELYVLTYYSAIGSVPTNKNYYQSVYCAYDDKGDYKYKNFVIVLDNWANLNFADNRNVVTNADGFYNTLNDGFIMFDDSTKNDLENLKLHTNLVILSIASSVDSLRVLLVGIAMFRLLPFMIILVAVLGLFIFLICKIKNRSYALKFLAGFKIASSFLIVTGMLSGLIGLVLLFFLDLDAAYSWVIWSFVVILSIRCILFVAIEAIMINKNPDRDKVVTKSLSYATSNEDELTDNGNNLDLEGASKKHKTKVIKNEQVKDDDDETMELM